MIGFMGVRESLTSFVTSAAGFPFQARRDRAYSKPRNREIIIAGGKVGPHKKNIIG